MIDKYNALIDHTSLLFIMKHQFIIKAKKVGIISNFNNKNMIAHINGNRIIYNYLDNNAFRIFIFNKKKSYRNTII